MADQAWHLLPVPWVAPVWAPMVVSLALITVGLVVALVGRTPSNFAWPVFVAGMALAVIGVAPLCWFGKNRAFK